MIPDGLERCATCGELKGTFLYADGWGAKMTPVRCICDGIACTNCSRNRIRRPTSNYYDERDGRVWHTPYFLTICRECIAARRWSPGGH